jgi:type I restriction enzyme S subunit
MSARRHNWTEERVESFAQVVTGGTPSTRKVEFWRNGTIPWLNSGELNKGIITQAENFITEDALNKSSAKMMPVDTVLIALTGATTGVSALLRTPACGNQSVTGILPSSRHVPRFLFRFLQLIRPVIVSQSYGGAQPHISQGYVKKLKVPLPPLTEQERIADLLDEADELRRLRAQADRRTAALIPALFHEMFGSPANETSRLPLGEIVTFGSGGTPSKENTDFWNGQTPWVSPKDMKADEIDDAEDHVSLAAFQRTNLQLIPKDTVLIVVRGMILAHTVPIRCCRVPVAINQDMKALLPKRPIEPDFLRWALQAQHPSLLTQISTAGHSEKLKAVTIPVPPLPLQQEFAKRATGIRQLEATQAASRRRLDDLFQSMLHRAFEGEL